MPDDLSEARKYAAEAARMEPQTPADAALLSFALSNLVVADRLGALLDRGMGVGRPLPPRPTAPRPPSVPQMASSVRNPYPPSVERTPPLTDTQVSQYVDDVPELQAAELAREREREEYESQKQEDAEKRRERRQRERELHARTGVFGQMGGS